MITVTIGALTLSSLSPADIERFIDGQRMEGYGPGIIIAEQHADLNGDDVEDGVLLFTYQAGTSQNRNHTQYLAVILSDNTGYVTSSTRIVGGKRNALWEKVVVVGGAIWLEGKKYLSDDAECCPTGVAKAKYVLTKGELFEAQGEWRRGD